MRGIGGLNAGYGKLLDKDRQIVALIFLVLSKLSIIL